MEIKITKEDTKYLIVIIDLEKESFVLQDIRKREGFNRPIEIDQAVFLYCNGKSHFSRNAMENLNKITGGEISLGLVDFL